ncbi:tetratricopeptide repeat protein [Flavobacterium sp. RHBU_3]|uniref:tetratricopeptide repeat protein n=1 Tax=Flavobacterium sp. RHBU_3 TaxID=3391184 RepID=UPI00398533F6
MKTKEELLEEVEGLFEEKKYQSILDILSDEILEEYCSSELWKVRSRAFNKLDNNPRAVLDATRSIDIDPTHALVYNYRGIAYLSMYDFDNAENDFKKSISLNSDNMGPHNNLGNVYFHREQFSKALEEYNIALKLDPLEVIFYTNKGLVYDKLHEFDEAIKCFTMAIEINENYAKSYRLRGSVFEQTKKYSKAIEDFKKYLQLESHNKFLMKSVKVRIKELKKKLVFVPYEEISEIILQIKELLSFSGNCITHYTAFSTAKKLILEDESCFRLSEGTFLNDTSEGRVLFKELNFYITNKADNENKSESEPFTEKPFIGSFVAETKHDDLALWRMYGKENKEEARGCALTLDRAVFINNILDSISNESSENDLSLDSEFVFYNVAYISKNNAKNFVVPNNPKIEDKLNELIEELKGKLRGRKSRELKVSIAEKLNEIVYLFKDAEYQYENEVRLIVSGVGFPKVVNFENGFGVYIYLTDIRPALHKITLGPKVEKAEEFAAALNYFLKEKYEDKNVEIIMSHLPFK